MMRITSEPLVQALKSASTSPEVIMKLAKKNNLAVLSFEIAVQTRQNKKASVTQDVKIEVMSTADVENLKEPMCPEPDASLSSFMLTRSFLTVQPGPYNSSSTIQTPYRHRTSPSTFRYHGYFS